jgi:hypothetical protein
MGRKVEQGANYRGLNYRGETRHLLRLLEAIEGDHRHTLDWKRGAISICKQLVNHLNAADEHATDPEESTGTS